MKKLLTKNYLIIIFLIIFFVWMWILLSFFSAEEIVSYVWIENTYLVIFLIAAIWWFSSIAWYPLIAIMATFITWGSNTFFIWLATWVGITFWDSLFYYFWIKSRNIVEWKYKKYVDKLTKFLKKRSDYFMPIIIYLYTWFAPLPNDILTVSAWLSGYPYKKALIPMILWNITHMMIYAYLIHFWIAFVS